MLGRANYPCMTDTALISFILSLCVSLTYNLTIRVYGEFRHSLLYCSFVLHCAAAKYTLLLLGYAS